MIAVCSDCIVHSLQSVGGERSQAARVGGLAALGAGVVRKGRARKWARSGRGWGVWPRYGYRRVLPRCWVVRVGGGWFLGLPGGKRRGAADGERRGGFRGCGGSARGCDELTTIRGQWQAGGTFSRARGGGGGEEESGERRGRVGGWIQGGGFSRDRCCRRRRWAGSTAADTGGVRQFTPG